MRYLKSEERRERGGGGYSFRELTKTPFINCEQSEHDRGSRTRGDDTTRRIEWIETNDPGPGEPVSNR